jgi:DNA repair exonuclease SbcCD ATPase subunit
MSKVGLYTDFHLHLWKSFGKSTGDGLPVRFHEQVAVLKQMLGEFKKAKISLLINGGDTFHKDSDVPTECVNVMTNFVDDIHNSGIPQVWCCGNHDISNKKTPTWMNKTHWSLESRYPYNCEDFKDAKIKLIDYYEGVDLSTVKGYDIVMVHRQPILTNKFGYTYEGIDWKQLADTNRLVFFGHYHENKQLAPNCWIMGPPMHLTFGDEGERGIWFVDTETWKVTFKKMDYPDFVTVENSDGVKDDGNYYRVLNSKTKFDSERVVTAVIPEVFEERIKSEDFIQILSEWATLNHKSQEYVDAIIPIANQKMQAAKNVYKGKIFEVDIKNFFSIGQIRYRVKKGFHIISGRNVDFDSNGSGKTSLFEAIYWCLFGKTTKGNLRADEYIRDGEKDCEVKVLFHNPESNDGYAITRSKKEGPKVYVCDHASQVWDDMTEGKTRPECERAIVDLLGFDEKVYLASCYFSQENITMLTGLGDADRTNMITDLLGFEKYDDLHEVAKKTSEHNQQILTQSEMDVKAIDNDITWITENRDKSARRLLDIDKQINDKSIMVKEKNEAIKVLATQFNALIKPKIDLADIDAKIKQIEDASHTLRLSLGGTRDSVKNCETEYRKLENDTNKILNEFNLQKHDVEKLSKELQEINSVHEKNTGKFCKHCGSIITSENKASFVSDIKSKIEAIKPVLIDLRDRYGLAKKRYEDYLPTLEKEKQHEKEAEQKIEEFNERLRKANTVKSNLLVQNKEYEVKSMELSKQIQSNENLISNLNYDINNVLTKEKITVSKEISTNEAKIKERNDKKLQISKDFTVAQKNREIFDFWKEAFSTTGIRSVLLDRFCNEFNVILNQYLSLISNGSMGIIVTPTKKTGGGVERNKIGIIIDNNGVERNYLALSGGEKRRVDVSLCMGLNKWVSSKYHIQEGLLGIIILDELFSFVDRLGEESIAGLLYTEGNHRAIFVISHTPDIGSYTRNIWTVVKENGVSSLQIAEG